MLTKREKVLPIVNARCAYWNQGKPKGITKKIMTVLKVIPDHQSPMHFHHQDFFKEANLKKALDRFIVDR